MLKIFITANSGTISDYRRLSQRGYEGNAQPAKSERYKEPNYEKHSKSCQRSQFGHFRDLLRYAAL